MILRWIIFLGSLYFVSCQSSLRFIQVWFRHGERLPTHYLHFPNDSPSTLFLEIAEPGELTTRGIRQEYDLGKVLRENYGEFLGEYAPSRLHTYTGVDNRTVASAQAVMAGLFPPSANRQWNKDLLWQPISMHTDESVDWVSTGIETVCPVYEKKLFSSPEYKAIPSQLDQNLLSIIRNATGGLPRDDVVDVNRVVDSLRVRKFLNDSRLPFPSWAFPIQDKLDDALFQLHNRVLTLQNSTVGGYHMEKTLAYMEDHLLRPVDKRNKAVFIAGHDTNFLALGKAFGIREMEDALPYYGSLFVAELHEIKGQNILKFYYSSGAGKQATEVKIEFCDQVCSLERLQELAKGFRVSTSEMTKECKGFGEISDAKSITFGILVALTAIFLISTIILGCTSCSYKRQLRNLKDPERQRLI